MGVSGLQAGLQPQILGILFEQPLSGDPFVPLFFPPFVVYIVLRAYGTRNAGIFVVQTGGFEDFSFVDEMVVVAQCGFVNGIDLCFWDLSLGLDCFFYNGHGRNGEVHSCGLLLSCWDLDSNSPFDFMLGSGYLRRKKSLWYRKKTRDSLSRIKRQV